MFTIDKVYDEIRKNHSEEDTQQLMEIVDKYATDVMDSAFTVFSHWCKVCHIDFGTNYATADEIVEMFYDDMG